MVNTVYAIDGPMKGATFALNPDTTTVGRSTDNDICISDLGVSRFHAQFLKKDDRVFIVDLNSSHGVFIDGKRIEPGQEVEVKRENIVLLGHSVLSFQEESSAKTAAQLPHRSPQEKLFDTNEPALVRDRSRTHVRSLELLLNVSNIFAQSINIHELLGEVMNQILALLKRIDRGAILLVDRETGDLQEIVSKTRMDDKQYSSSKINYSRSIVHRAIREGKPVSMSNTERVNRAALSESMMQMNVRSVMCVPLIHKGDVRGVIYVDSIGLPEGFRRDDLQLLTGLSKTAGIAIENARLYEAMKQELTERKRAEQALRKAHEELELRVKDRTADLAAANAALRTEITERKRIAEELRRISYLDALTGVANRRHFEETLDREWRRATRGANSLSLIMCDIDFFKAYNDTYGHVRGDNCLKQVASVLRESLKRPADMVARYGGEEFVVVLPDTDVTGAAVIAKAQRASVEALGIPHASSPICDTLTISAGVATAIPSPDSSPAALVSVSDHALYQAKDRGRNRVQIAD